MKEISIIVNPKFSLIIELLTLGDKLGDMATYSYGVSRFNFNR
jgi:hypothetical protein